MIQRTQQSESRLLLAEMLLARAREIGEAAARELCAHCAEARDAFSPLSIAKWGEQLQGRVQELAAAVAYDAPDSFVAQIGWTRSAFTVRGVCCSHIATSLTALTKVLARELPPDDFAWVENLLARAAREAAAPACDSSSKLSSDSALALASAEYLVAILEGDRRKAAERIRVLQESGVEAAAIYTGVLGPSLCEIGRLWHLGEISVAEEHFATTTTQRVMSEVCARATPARRDGRAVVAASVEGDFHDMGVRVIADLLELSGWRVVFLGASIPADELAGAVRDFEGDLVAISATLPVHLRAVEAAVASVRALPRRCPVLVGGSAFCQCPDAWRAMGADGFALGAADAVRAAEQLAPRKG